jgi:hypothetical protein
MKVIKIFAAIGLFPLISNALVTSPSGSQTGAWTAEWKSTLERGKVEPNENRSSFQSAQIDVHQLGISKGLDISSYGSDHFARIDLKYFKSSEESVAGQTFYQADTGNALSLSYGFNFVHEPSFAAGVYFSATPLIYFNKDKFSVPRIDLWNLGFKTSVKISDRFFTENNVHYGSGISGKQNSYLAFTNLFGFRLSPESSQAPILKWGPYAELDTSERTDPQYDQAFSPPGNSDRIRSMKIGVVSSIGASISENTYGTLTYVQKLGGYDAPATNAVSLSLGYSFE